MSLVETAYGQPFPRRQAQGLAELLARPDSALRAALVGRRREGKSDLLGQLHALLFQRADGPLPFHYSFAARREAGDLARHFAAAFCQQMRAFVMRQEELLGEPLARLETELERPGLPLALTELGREFLSLPAAEQSEFAAALPASLAHREGRPLCLLFDDVEGIAPGGPPFFSYFKDPRLSWLITARAPVVKCIAAEHGWLLTSLQPFSHQEALSLAEQRCREFELPFVRLPWEDWLETAGTSPAWIHGLIEAAVLAGRELDSIEALGQVYIQELAAGSFASWMGGRWSRVFAPPDAAGLHSDVSEKARVAQQLLAAAHREPESAGTIPPALWKGLVAEEWAEETPMGARVRLERIEADWLQLALDPAGAASERAQAGALQAFLLRAEGVRHWRQASGVLTDLRESLRRLPQSGVAGPGARGSKEFRLPVIFSVATERTGAAELYWCYGFRPDWPKERRDRLEAASLYLIAVCREQPSASEVKQWNRRLQEQARSLPAAGGAEKTASAGLGPRSELWLALPPGAPLAAVSGERRLRWEDLERLIEPKTQRPSETLPPMLQLERTENEVRLHELEARAQWLEEELATAREQFRRESGQIPPMQKAAAEGEASPVPAAAEAEDRSAGIALSVSLLLAAADLLALQSQADPALLDAIREIQRKSQKLADTLRA